MTHDLDLDFGVSKISKSQIVGVVDDWVSKNYEGVGGLFTCEAMQRAEGVTKLNTKVSGFSQ